MHRIAQAVRPNDLLAVDGRLRLVRTVRADRSTPMKPRVVITFHDGGPLLRVPAITRLVVHTP